MNSLVVLVLVLSANRALALHESWFVNETMCDVEERLNRGCSTEKNDVHGKMECVAACGRNISCIGASLDATGKCFHHQLCVSTMVCTQPNPEHDYMARFCVHGTWDRATHSCKCIMASFGTRCDNYPRNCGTLVEAKYPTGQYRVFLDPFQNRTNIVDVECDIQPYEKHGVLIYSNTGKLDFNRTFDEYENGFRADDLNLWSGLKLLHMLSQIGCDFVIVTLKFGPYSEVSRRHRNFKVTGKDSGYSFTFTIDYARRKNEPDGFNAGPCLNNLKNKPFSTWDNDRDGDSQTNCASQAGSGWWYSGCNNPCNLLGWGLEDYANTPTHQRLSMLNVSVGASPVLITRSKATYNCSPE